MAYNNHKGLQKNTIRNLWLFCGTQMLTRILLAKSLLLLVKSTLRLGQEYGGEITLND